MSIATYEPTKLRKQRVVETTLRGKDLIENPLLNKGSAFTEDERKNLGLLGLISPDLETLNLQLERVYDAYQQINTPLGKYIYLRSLQDDNEILFYVFIETYIEEILPIFYSSTVAETCRHFGQISSKLRGLCISYSEKDKFDKIFDNFKAEDIRVIVVNDGERILGCGDQGIDGIGIPLGIASMHTICGGLNPAYGLPIILDVGTDNQDKLNDPLYLGCRHPRIRGKEYEDFIDLFVQAVIKKFPHVMLQWTDFPHDTAQRIINRYRRKLCTFNDEIQGDLNSNKPSFYIDQENHFLLFPAIGLAVTAAQIPRISDGMVIAAKDALSDHTRTLLRNPTVIHIVTKKIALVIAVKAEEEGIIPLASTEKLRNKIEDNFWYPAYPIIQYKQS